MGREERSLKQVSESRHGARNGVRCSVDHVPAPTVRTARTACSAYADDQGLWTIYWSSVLPSWSPVR